MTALLRSLRRRLAVTGEEYVTADTWWAVWILDRDEPAHRRPYGTPGEAQAWLNDNGYTNAWIELELANY